jgi:hypothetical protein
MLININSLNLPPLAQSNFLASEWRQCLHRLESASNWLVSLFLGTAEFGDAMPAEQA